MREKPILGCRHEKIDDIDSLMLLRALGIADYAAAKWPRR